MQNFVKVMQGIDVTPLLRQVADHAHLWNTDTVRTSVAYTVHYDVDDIILRYPGSGPNWNTSAFNLLSAAQPLVFNLMAAVRGELLGRVLISRLAAGKVIPPHTDHLHGVPMFYKRYQFPLVADAQVMFQCGDEQVAMLPGDVYWFDNTILHAVINNSQHARLAMVVDIRPFTPIADQESQ